MQDKAIIDCQFAALRRLVESMFVLVGMVAGGPFARVMPTEVRRQVLRMLRPSESALRRLIVIWARGLRVAAGPKRCAPKHPIPKGNGSSDRIPSFVLFDPRKWFRELAKTRRPQRGPGPRISGFDEPRTPVEQSSGPSTISPTNVCRRLQALHKALENIPAQAKRLARLQAKRRAAGATFRKIEPLRPGFPPGYRKHRTHIVDEILYELDVLVRREPRPPERA